MALPGHILLLLLIPVATAQTTPGPCSGCGPLSLPLLAGLVAADAVMSLLIVGVVFVCARHATGPRRKKAKSTSTCLAGADLPDFLPIATVDF